MDRMSRIAGSCGGVLCVLTQRLGGTEVRRVLILGFLGWGSGLCGLVADFADLSLSSVGVWGLRFWISR